MKLAIWDILTIIVILALAGVAGLYGLLFLFPQFPLNPFPPPASYEPTLPVSDTAAALLLTKTPKYTVTKSPVPATVTRTQNPFAKATPTTRPSATVTYTETLTPTISLTPSETVPPTLSPTITVPTSTGTPPTATPTITLTRTATRTRTPSNTVNAYQLTSVAQTANANNTRAAWTKTAAAQKTQTQGVGATNTARAATLTQDAWNFRLTQTADAWKWKQTQDAYNYSLTQTVAAQTIIAGPTKTFEMAQTRAQQTANAQTATAARGTVIANITETATEQIRQQATQAALGRIAFSVDDDGVGAPPRYMESFHIVDYNGASEQVVTAAGLSLTNLGTIGGWTRDGTLWRLFYDASGILYKIFSNLTGWTSVPGAPPGGTNNQASVFPITSTVINDQWVVFTNVPAPGAKRDIWRMRLDSFGPQRITSEFPDAYDDYDPSWTPDGQVIYISARGDAPAVTNIYLIDVNSLDIAPLTFSTSQKASPVWCRGYDWTLETYVDRIAFAIYDGTQWDIYVGTNLSDLENGVINVTNTPASNETEPSWGPYCSGIVYVSDETGVRSVYRLNFEPYLPLAPTPNPVIIATPAGGTLYNPEWQPIDQ